MTATPQPRGKVHLVGAGPGAPELLTIKALALLRTADVVLHDDLVPAEIVSLAGPQAEVVNVGKRCGPKSITQTEVNRRMIAAANRGLDVVRLKSGDPGVFGRLADEIAALDEAGVPFEIVPGITAAMAAAAALRAPLTERVISSQIVMLSGHQAADESSHESAEWRKLASSGATLAIYMPGHDWKALAAKLRDAGLEDATPCAVVSRVSMPDERRYSLSVGELTSLPAIEPPSILLVGRVLRRATRARKIQVALAELAELGIPVVTREHANERSPQPWLSI